MKTVHFLSSLHLHLSLDSRRGAEMEHGYRYKRRNTDLKRNVELVFSWWASVLGVGWESLTSLWGRWRRACRVEDIVAQSETN